MTVAENVRGRAARRPAGPTPRSPSGVERVLTTGRPRRLRGGLPARAVRRHEAARRHGPRAGGRSRRSCSWTSRSARSTRSPPRACGPRCSTSGPAHGHRLDVDPDGQPRHQGSRLHGRPHRRARRPTRAGSARSSRTACRGRATTARRELLAPGRSAARHHHRRRAARRAAGRPRPAPVDRAAAARRRRARSSACSSTSTPAAARRTCSASPPTPTASSARSSTIVEAAEMLDFVDTPKRMVVLEPDGRKLRGGQARGAAGHLARAAPASCGCSATWPTR